MLKIPLIKETEYNGENFPTIINEILTNNNVIFGGSSLIHDIFFREEDWGERDYDLWCIDKQYYKIQSILRKKENCKKIKEEHFESRYGRIKMYGLCEYKYKTDETNEIKIQLINVGKDFSTMIKNLDFTFVSIIYDGKKLKYINTTENEIIHKKGSILNVISECTCSECRTSSISEKTMSRIKKYQKRGFTFLNICPFCTKNYILSPKHFLNCKKLIIDGEIQKDKQKEIFQLGNETDNPELVLCCLNYFSKIYDMECWINLFYAKKSILQPHFINFKILIKNCINNGQYTFFKNLYELGNYNFKNSKDFFNISCQKNYLNISRYLNNIFPRFHIEIFEDAIVKYKILSVFEYYLETNDKEIITKEYPQISFIEPDEENICPICKYFPTNLKLTCEHKFCDKCFISYLASLQDKHEKLKCGICRLNL